MAAGTALPALGFALALATAPALAQSGVPHLGYVYPAGGCRGSTFEVTLGGQFLNGVTNALVSGGGIQAVVVGFTRPLNGKEMNELREKLREFQQRSGRAPMRAGTPNPTATPNPTNTPLTAAERAMIPPIRRQIAASQRRLLNPAISDTVTLRVALAADAAPGDREVRLETATGLSNPIRFCVGTLPECVRPLLAERVEAAPPGPAANPREVTPVASTEMGVLLPAVLNGQIGPGGVDRFRFAAHRGQRLLVAASARALMPYLADAVPGWFQAAVSMADAKGHELAFADHYRFQQDPVLFFDVPADGDYVLTIRDTLYRGRDDFVYRVSVGELPFITSHFPLGGRAGLPATVALNGWNLPVTNLTVDAKSAATGRMSLSVQRDGHDSNPVLFAFDPLPEDTEQEPNNTPANAQLVAVPMIINGRVDPPGDADVFRFEGHAGDEIVAEVQARRLGSPLDSLLTLTDPAGRPIAANDDHEDKAAWFETHHADSYLRTVLPATGTYFLRLSDTEGHGGPDYGYRLRISAPQPDFALRAVPASLTIRGGASVPLTIHALRRDGFTNEIALSLKDPPPGFKLSGARVAAGQDTAPITLSAPPSPTAEPVRVVIEGRATINGREVIHAAVPATDMMQAFAYHHLVPASELAVKVVERPGAKINLLSAVPVKLPAGGSARVRFSTPGPRFTERFELALNEPPPGISLGRVSAVNQGAELELRSDASQVKPGWKGNVIVNILPVRNPRATNAPAGRRPPPVGTLPAIPVEIVGP
jgi:hypothetical protein